MLDLSWNEIEEIFSKAVELPESQRLSFLREACAANEVLYSKILSLLNADRKAENYLENSMVLPDTLSKLIFTPETLSGQIFGAYRILEEIGRGGMGAVYLAERADGEFEKKVAVKIIKRDLDLDFNQMRFRRERQILAEFDHPNIAKLLDGGTTTEGVPYLIMEFINGESLLDYCATHNFKVEQRLKIFQEVCSAVSYAHHRKIIHRDIKPSNILVNEQGTPKLLDFGIAKILDADLISESAHPTETLFQQLTPEYASPEQVKNEQITEASDVYSLGVLLYELLTGERPYNFPSRSSYEIARVICEQEAPSLRSKAVIFSGKINADLENIVSKTLQKNPQNRYASVEEFSRDIDNFLLGQAIPTNVIANNFSEKNLSNENGSQGTSIAVVPLKFLQIESEENEENFGENFLGVGLSDALTTLLSSVQELIVRPTSSVVWYAKQQNDPFLLGQKLNVDFVLEGKILRVNSQLRVTIQMLRISDNEVVWTSQFNENETDIFRLQDLIAEKTVASLKPHLTTGEQISLNPGKTRSGGTTNSKAYEAYLRGKYYWNTYTVEGIVESEKYFKEAISYDSDFALAHSGLADFYNWRGVAEFSLPVHSFPAAKKAALKAIELDENSAEAYASLAFAVWAYDWDVKKAESLYQKSIELNPNYSKAHEWYAYLLSSAGRHDEVLAKMQAAEKLDPLSAALKSMFSFCLYNARHYEEGLEKLEEALELEPNHYLALQGLGWVCPPLGKFQEAVDGCRRAVKISDAAVLNIASLTLSLAAAGQTNEARQLAAEIEERRKTSHLPAYFPALIYTVLGNFDKAFAWLDMAIEERGYWTQWMRVEPRFDALRKDPRFAEIEKRTGALHAETKANKQADFKKIAEKPAKIRFKKKHFYKAIAAAAGLLLVIFFGFFSFASKKESLSQTVDFNQTLPAKTANTLLILPFKAEAGNDSILSSGLTDELKSDLGRFKRLSVLSVGKNQISGDIKEIGRTLNADFVLRGNLQNYGEKIQLSTELINAGNGEIIWREKFAAAKNELASLRGQISERVLNALSVELSSGEREYIAKSYTNDAEAFQLYLAGRYQLGSRTKEGFEKAIKNFSSAVERDPKFALAYAGLADSFILLDSYSPSNLSSDFLKKAETNANKALSLDENLAEAHTSLAQVKVMTAKAAKIKSSAEAENHFLRAIELNPSYSTAHHWYGNYLFYQKRFEEALVQMENAARLEPRSVIIQTSLGTTYITLHRCDAAIPQYDKAIEIDNGHAYAYAMKSFCQQVGGDYRGALQTFTNARIFQDTPENKLTEQIMTIQALAFEGKRDEVMENLNRIFKDPRLKQNVSAYAVDIALVYDLLNEKEQAFQWLDKIKDPQVQFQISKDLRFKNVRTDERFIKKIADADSKINRS